MQTQEPGTLLLAQGTTLSGRHEVLGVLGKGACGMVLKVIDHALKNRQD